MHYRSPVICHQGHDFFLLYPQLLFSILLLGELHTSHAGVAGPVLNRLPSSLRGSTSSLCLLSPKFLCPLTSGWIWPMGNMVGSHSKGRHLSPRLLPHPPHAHNRLLFSALMLTALIRWSSHVSLLYVSVTLSLPALPTPPVRAGPLAISLDSAHINPFINTSQITSCSVLCFLPGSWLIVRSMLKSVSLGPSFHAGDHWPPYFRKPTLPSCPWTSVFTTCCALYLPGRFCKCCSLS